MAKIRKHQASKSRAGGGNVRVVCPQCGKRVNVPAQLSPTQQAYPCPACRVPIGRAVIEAAKAEAEAPSEAAAPPTTEAAAPSAASENESQADESAD